MKAKKVKIIVGFFIICCIAVLVLSGIKTLANFDEFEDESQSMPRAAYIINALEVEAEIETNSPALGTSAQGAVLIDAWSRNIIYEHNAYKRLPMASTTKIITAITAIESGVPLDAVIKITKEMTGAEGSSIYLYEGERFTLNDLLYALLLNSANDSAEAIAIGIAGSVEKFADMMNEKVRELNLTNTHLTNPHGLDSDMHYTTAYDLAVISAYSLENEKFREIVGTRDIMICPLNLDGTENHEGKRFLRNHNKMLRIYPDAIGVKTGFTKRSGRCLVSAAERDGTRLVAVTINASDDWNDHENMLNYGFKNYSTVELCGEFEHKFDVNIVNGAEALRVQCANISAEYASLPSYVKREDIEYRVELPEFIYAPVNKSDVAGRIIFIYKDKIIAQSAIVSLEAVAANESESIIDKIKNIVTFLFAKKEK